MSKKIEVSQELMNQIIDCYVNRQLSLQKTLVELNLPFGIGPLKRMLREQNVHIRTYKEAVSQGLRGPVPNDIKNQIIELYNCGFSIERIQKELSQFYSTDKIKTTLVENNVTIRTLEEAKQVQIKTEERKYLLDDNYNLESHNGAWLLGMFASDGYVPKQKNRLILSLAKKDEEILYKIKDELQYEGPINQYIASDGIHEFSSLGFTSAILREKFEKYGIVNNKTFKLNKLPELPDEYMIDFIRGYIDGDGSIYDKRGLPIFRITSASKEFLENMQKYIQEHYNIKSVIHKDHNAFDLEFAGYASIELGHLMYDNDYIALARKKQRFYEIINPTSLSAPQEQKDMPN